MRRALLLPVLFVAAAAALAGCYHDAPYDGGGGDQIGHEYEPEDPARAPHGPPPAPPPEDARPVAS